MRKLVLAAVSLLVSCAPFRDSPFSDQLLRRDRDLNAKALAALGDVEADGKIRIAVFSDSHQNYVDLDHALYGINLQSDVDFVVNLGT